MAKHSNTTIICFHGSPGSPEDFNGLKKYLGNVEVIAISRYIRKNVSKSTDSNNDKNKQLVLGYSWGGLPAINYAINNFQSISGIILISPYLFPTKSKLIKNITDIPLLGKFLLKVMGKQFVGDLLKKSSYPDQPTSDYKRASYSYIPILKASIDEKSQKENAIELLRKTKKLSIPLILIWGESDLTSRESTQIQPIRINSRLILEEKIKYAGHALIFTKPKEVAEVIFKTISIV